jgi:hypothetical protein
VRLTTSLSIKPARLATSPIKAARFSLNRAAFCFSIGITAEYNSDKDDVVVWFDTNQVADPKLEPLPAAS